MYKLSIDWVSMPSRAYAPFLLAIRQTSISYTTRRVTALTGLCPISTENNATERDYSAVNSVNALTGLCPISTINYFGPCISFGVVVSMPSRAYTSFLHDITRSEFLRGLHVSMPSRAYTSFLLATSLTCHSLW